MAAIPLSSSRRIVGWIVTVLLAWAWGLGSVVATRAAVAETYRWRNVEIEGGGFVSGLVFHPTERDLLYARTDVGGAFRLDATTGVWVPLNDDLGREDAQLTGVLSLAVDPHDPERVYLAVGQYLPSWARTGAILRSNDRGATWTRTELPIRLGGNADGRNTGERLQVDPNDGRILYLGTSQDGLWRSVDRGVTWGRVGAFPSDVVGTTLVVFDAKSGANGSATRTLYVARATTAGASLVRSTDAGATWAVVPGQPTGWMPHRAAFGGPTGRTLFLAGGNALGPNGVTSGAVWKLETETGGWTDITPPKADGGFAGLAVDPAQPTHLVVSTLDRWSAGDELYRSTDAGATWRPILRAAKKDTSAVPWAGSRSPHWIADVAIDPFNADHAVFVTGYGVFRTRTLTAADTGSGGALPTWTFFNRGLEETVPLGVVAPPDGPLLSVLGDIGGFVHRDHGATPALADYFATHRGTNVGLDVAWLAPRTVVRTHYEGTRGSYSLDGGATWTDFANGVAAATSNGPGVVAVGADGTAWVWMPERSGAFVSTDRGATWVASVGSPASASESLVPVADRVNGRRFAIYDRPNGRVYVSVDGGATFGVGGTVPAWGAVLKAVPGREGQAWLGAGDGGLYRTTDGGRTFTVVSGVEKAFRVGFGRAAAADGEPTVFLWGRVAGTDGLYRSVDTGATWTLIDAPTSRFGWINELVGDPAVFGRVYLATGGRGIIVGEVVGVVPETTWARFSIGENGSQRIALKEGIQAVFSASGLPAWLTLVPATGELRGTPPADAAGLSTILVEARVDGWLVGTTRVVVVVARGQAALEVSGLSTRAWVGTGADILIAGVAFGGAEARRLLVRGVGPTLTSFGVGGALSDPRLTLMSGSTALLRNDDWGGGLAAAFARAGLFELPATSRDAAFETALLPGGYTVLVEGQEGGTGVAIAEAYDVSPEGGGGGLGSLSSRVRVGGGERSLIAGIALRGAGARQVLARAVGPTLAEFGVEDALRDPVLTMYAGTSVLATNDDWGRGDDPTLVSAVTGPAGAFALPAAGRDAALVATLPAGNYTFVVSSKAGASGVALVELYLLP